MCLPLRKFTLTSVVRDIELRQKASFKPNEKMRCFFGIGNCDSKNFCGFVVDEFSKLVHTMRSLTESFRGTSVKISDYRAFSPLRPCPGAGHLATVKF